MTAKLPALPLISAWVASLSDRGINFKIILLATVLGGCAATKQEVATRLGDQYVGKNVDELVVKFGPPSSSFRMNSGETSHVWQLTSVTNMHVVHSEHSSSGRAKMYHCKVSVIASPTGIISQLTTEDAGGTRGILGAIGVDIYGSICAQHLGMKRET